MGSLDPNEFYFWKRMRKNSHVIWLIVLIVVIYWWTG
jgi:hypothetical protein